MSTESRRADRWESMSDGDVIRDLAQWGIRVHEQLGAAARLRRIARDIDRADVGGARCSACGACRHSTDEHNAGDEEDA